MKPLYIKDAIKLLKEDYVLESFSNNEKMVFVKENARIAVYSGKYNAYVSFTDFENLYKDFTFFPIKENERETIDLKKDEEYYSSIQKRQ